MTESKIMDASRAAACQPFSEVGPEALLRLGIDVRAPLAHLRPTFEELLPAASDEGYFAALREAISRGEVASGDDADQLRWLADHLQLSVSGTYGLSMSWARAWDTALAEPGEPFPNELGPRARRVLLDELLSRPDYRLRLADALMEALRTELAQ